jgi:transposase
VWWLIWIVAVVVVAAVWFLFTSSELCPTCGLRVAQSDLDRLERQVFGRDHCPHCGAPL